MKRIDLSSGTEIHQLQIDKPNLSWRKRLGRRLRIKSMLARELLSETIGTFVLMSFTIGTAAQVKFGGEGAGGNMGNYLSSSMGVALAVYVSNVSGSNINPSVTLMFAITGRIKAWKAPLYMLAQFLGSFIASACIYGVYHDALNDFDGGKRQIAGPIGTAGIWATYPKDYLSTQSAFFTEVFCTAMLGLGVLSIMDKRNVMPELSLMPMTVNILILVISLSLALNTGCAMNPARDLSPRIFTAIAGWGSGVFSYANYYFWIPILGPYVGCTLGALFYTLFVGAHHPLQENNWIMERAVKMVGKDD